jgi:hypothetical protein
MSESIDGKRRRSRSLFGPFILIAIGVYFLLANMGVVSGLNWIAVLQLWPLWLIFVGVNIIVQQVERPLGSLLSGLVGLVAVGVFTYVLLFSQDNPILDRFGVAGNVEYKFEEISYSAEGVETAAIRLDFDAPGGTVNTLEDSNELIAGRVSYLGDLTFDASVTGSRAAVTLNDAYSGIWFINPGNWVNADDGYRWQLGLNPDVATDLDIDIGAGSAMLDLSQMTLTDFFLDGGAGSVTLMMPGGDYNAEMDVGAGSYEVTLPANGQHRIEIDGGAGSVTLFLPRGMDARVEIDDGAGSFRPDSRFSLVSGERNDDGVWETDGYDTIDVSAGSVRIEQPQGR